LDSINLGLDLLLDSLDLLLHLDLIRGGDSFNLVGDSFNLGILSKKNAFETLDLLVRVLFDCLGDALPSFAAYEVELGSFEHNHEVECFHVFQTVIVQEVHEHVVLSDQVNLVRVLGKSCSLLKVFVGR